MFYNPTTTRNPVRLPPDLLAALRALAEAEDLPLPTLIALLINEALRRRLRGQS